MASWIKHSKNFLKGYCKKNSFDVCLANFSLPGGEVGLSILKKFSVPFVVLSHGHDIPWMFPREMFIYHLLTFFRIKQICRHSEYNVLLTSAMKKNADKFLGSAYANKNVVIPNGCDYEFFKPDSTKKASYFKILFTGRFVKQKDPFVFLKALSLLSKENIPFTSKIVGDGPLRKKMETFVKCNALEKHITFTGWLSKEGLRNEYQTASVFVQSSRYEAMSVSPLEALACATYVICTKAGANSEIILENKTGEAFPSGQPETLFLKLKGFYNEKFIQDFKIDPLNINNVRSIYDWNTLVTEYEKILKLCVR